MSFAEPLYFLKEIAEVWQENGPDFCMEICGGEIDMENDVIGKAVPGPHNEATPHGVKRPKGGISTMPVLPSEELIQKSFAVVGAKPRDKNHSALQPILTDLITLGRVLKQLHWNVTGPHFRSIHLHLDEIYAIVDAGIDEVAERMTATGHSPDGRIREVAAKSEIEDAPAGFLADQRVLLLASHALKQTSELIRSRCEAIEDVDVVTADLLHQIVLDLEKHHWMLEATRV